MDHNGFSTRDELAYQFARDKREGKLLDYYQSQGINDNYPQYGMDFWGDDAADNYGFGSSDIEGKIDNHPAMNQTPFPKAAVNRSYDWSVRNEQQAEDQTSTPWNNHTESHSETALGNQTLTPWNGGYDLNSYRQPSYTERKMNNGTNQISDFSEFINSPLNMGLTAQPEQAHLRELDTSLIRNREIIDSPYSDNILENDCYQSQRFEPFARQVRWNEGENQGVIYATPDITGTDQPTKYGISQGALDLYRSKFNGIANTYPAKVRDLTEEQAMNLLCQYYKGSRAEAINDPNLAFSVYDSYFNSPKNAPIAWQKTLKSKVNPDISIGGGIGSQTVNNLNSVKSDTELLDTFIKNRKKTLDEKYKKGLISRFKRYPIK